MPGSQTSPGRPNACDGASARFAFRPTDSVGTRIQVYFAAQWLAYTLPYRRFADILADACARLGADADRYSFIAVDLHHLLLAGLPAHLLKNSVWTMPPKIPSLIGRSPFPAHGGVPATQDLLPKSPYGARRGTLDLSLLVA